MDDAQDQSSGQTEGGQRDPAVPLPEAQVTDILDHPNDPLYAVDEHWRITYVNRKAKGEEIWGRHRDDLLDNATRAMSFATAGNSWSRS